MKFVLLASLVAIVASSKTTITIVSSPNGQTTITTSTDDSAATIAADSSSVPTADEIALIRDVYPFIQTKKVLVRVVTDHFVFHPDVQLLLPEPYASMPLADLQNNADFQQQAYVYMLLATNFIVKNLDNPEYLEKHFRRLDNYWGSKWYVTYVDEQRQLDETVRIFSRVIDQELGGTLSAQAKAAFSKALKYAFSFLGTAQSTGASGTSVLSADELSLVRSTYNSLIKGNVKLAENCMLKHFVLHPAVQKLYPGLADVPLADLPNSDEFHTQAYVALFALDWIVNNLDNDELLAYHLSRVNIPNFYVDYMDPLHQFDETTRLFLESANEVLGSSFTADAAAAYKKAFDHVTDIMTAKATTSVNGVALDTSVKRVSAGCPGIPSKVKALIRDTWSLARRNADIAPKIFLKMFEAHPETQKMFPRLANVPFEDLRANKFFQQQVYNCLFGLTVIIKNIDTPDLVATLLRNMASPNFYVDGPSAAQQLDETTRIFNEVMQEELGAVYSADVQDAFTTLFGYVNEVLAKADGDNVPTDFDKQIMRDNMNVIKQQNNNIGAKILLKLLKAHPDTQKLFKNFASVPLADLPDNAEFKAYGNMLTAGLNFMIDNLDDTSLMRQMLSSKKAAAYFVPGVSIRMQLEETFRVAIEAIGEELGDRFTAKTKAAFTRGLRFLNIVQDESFNF